MKKITVLILTILFPLASYGGTKITDTISVSKYVKPDTYLLPVTVKYKAWDEGKVLQTLGEVDSKIRALSLPYEGGKFRVEENRFWDGVKKRYVTEGFVGSVTYLFKLKKVKDQEMIFRLLNEESKLKEVRYQVTSPNWVVSERRRKLIEKKLKRELLREALREAELFGRDLKAQCKVDSINFRKRPFFPYPVFRKSVSIAPEPKKSSKEINLQAEVTLICENKGGSR